MHFLNRKERLILLVGDMLFFMLSLWITLVVRYGALPSLDLFSLHWVPFFFLTLLFIAVFFIAGLYEKHTLLLQNHLPKTILKAELVGSALAVSFFYLAPWTGIAPKRNLFIYLLISFVLITLWRMYGYAFVGTRKKQKAALIGSGNEMQELLDEVNNNSRYDLKFVSSIDLNHISQVDLKEEVTNRIYSKDISIIAIDLRNEKVLPLLPHLYTLIFSSIRFIEMHKIYEDIFDRIPLSLVGYSWVLENISLAPKSVYDFLKRVMDISISFLLGVVSLIVYPFVYVAIKLDDGGKVFSIQERVGRNNKLIKLYKFRTMQIANDGGRWQEGVVNQTTRVGSFLRQSRIDELPQLWNVLFGDISLIGPRPEFPEPVSLYEKQVPYYGIRHLIKPGLSGWAQIYGEHPHHGTDVAKTKNKLSYDLYYIKNRSVFLDLKIALQTIKTLLLRSGI